MLKDCGVCSSVTWVRISHQTTVSVCFKELCKTNVGAAVDASNAKSAEFSCRWESECFY